MITTADAGGGVADFVTSGLSDVEVQALKDDPREICRASQDAQVMSDYLLGRTREKVPERESQSAEQRERPPRDPFRRPEKRSEQQMQFQREAAVPSR